MQVSADRVAAVSSARWKLYGTHWAIGCLVAYLQFYETAGQYWSERNRFFLFWQTSDLLGVVLPIVGVGACMVVGWHVAGCFGKIGQWGRGLVFTGFTLFFAKTTIWRIACNSEVEGLWLHYVLQVMFFGGTLLYLVRSQWVLRVLRGACLIFSPILIVYTVSLLTADSYVQPKINKSVPAVITVPPSETIVPIDRIVLVIFDGWSYYRTLEDGTPHVEMPELARIAEKCLVFTEAYSPKHRTYDSMPSLLTGLRGDSGLEDGVHTFKTESGVAPLATYPSMFTDMNSRGYTTICLANYLPYADFFGPIFDVCKSYDIERLGGDSIAGISTTMVLKTVYNTTKGKVPILAKPYVWLQTRYSADMVRDMHSKTLALFGQEDGGPYFQLLHYPVPHDPYVFDRDGPKRGINRLPLQSNLEGYLDNLAYSDRLIGEVYDAAMADTSKKTLLIMTADHSYRDDPAYENLAPAEADKLQRHIPIVVAMTGLEERHEVTIPFNSVAIRSVLNEFMSGPFTPEAFIEACRTHRTHNIEGNNF